MTRRRWGIAGLLALALAPSAASAAELAGTASTAVEGPPRTLREALRGLDTTGTPPPPPRRLDASEGELPEGGARSRPDYVGRPAASVEPGEVALWIPRLLLLPVHGLLEYGLRVPAVALLTVLEEHHVFARVERLFTFRDGKSAIYPTFLADFGLRPSVGLSSYHRDLLREGDVLRVGASFWVNDWIRVFGEAETPLFADQAGHLGLTAEFVTRPDQPFYGVGADTRQRDVGYYRLRQAAAGVRLRGDIDATSHFTFHADYRDVVLEDGQQVAIGERVAQGRFAAPPGFEAATRRGAYRLVEGRAELALDSRPPSDPRLRSAPGTGALFEGTGRLAVDPSDDALALAGGGLELAGFLDLSGFGHVLAMKAHVAGVRALGDAALPFTELPSLGGLEQMRGFLPRRFVGDAVALATFSYRYPIWYLVEAEVFLAFGNAWEDLGDFDLRRQYMSSGLALRSTFDRETRLELILAAGTDRLERGLEVDSVRVAFGVTEGF